MMPPCGVPLSAGKKFSSKKYPVLRNWASIAQSVGIFSMSQSWAMVSKQPLISPFRIHGVKLFLARHVNAYVDASYADRKSLNPNDLVQRFSITSTLNRGEYRPFLHTIRGFASQRTAFHRISPRTVPAPGRGGGGGRRPGGVGEWRGALRVGWGESQIWSVNLESVY